MSVLSFAQILRSYFLFSTIGFAFISEAISCQVYPSEYAYRDESVTRAESASANCRRYPIMDGIPAGVHSWDYINCDGTQLILADTNLGSEQPFSSSSHYQWSAGGGEQLLFIFPTRVSLTTITLHYYSDSLRGLPRLKFYAVPNDFDVWDVPSAGTPHVDAISVLPGGEPAGHRSVSINVNLDTKKVLMYKYSSTFQFAVSEVEFFTCITLITASSELNFPSEYTSQQTLPTTTKLLNVITRLTIPSMGPTIDHDGSLKFTKNEPCRTPLSSNQQIFYPREIIAWVLIVILVVLLIVSLVINVILSVWAYRRSNKSNDPSPDCAVAMDSNPCYEASKVKQTKAQEAIHVYETVKQQNNYYDFV